LEEKKILSEKILVAPYKKRITSSNTVVMSQDVAQIVIPIEKRIADLESDLRAQSTNNLSGMKIDENL
jgi:hypothetical protein